MDGSDEYIMTHVKEFACGFSFEAAYDSCIFRCFVSTYTHS